MTSKKIYVKEFFSVPASLVISLYLNQDFKYGPYITVYWDVLFRFFFLIHCFSSFRFPFSIIISFVGETKTFVVKFPKVWILLTEFLMSVNMFFRSFF